MAYKNSCYGILASAILALAGCEDPTSYYNFNLDLNGDGKQDKVWSQQRPTFDYYHNYEIFIQINLGNDKYSNPQLIANIKGYKMHSFFYDLDGDGDLDYIFEKEDSKNNFRIYIAKNDGKGNFNSEKLIPQYP